jgi:hypothetical protein
VLSVQQPWTEFLVSGRKPVENRPWDPSWRGPLLLHAGQRYDDAGAAWILSTFGIVPPSRASLERKGRMGAIVGGAVLVRTVAQHPSPWFCGPFGLVVEAAEPLETPLAYAGHLAVLDFEPRRAKPGQADQIRAVRELNERLWHRWERGTRAAARVA